MKNSVYLVTFSFFILILIGTAFPTPQEDIQVTILYDNYAAVDGVETDWGFSCLIEWIEKTILFDAGMQGDLLFRNVDTLKVDLDSIDCIVISHDHGDHTGGLIPLLEKKSDAPVYLLSSFQETLFQAVRQTGTKIVSVKDPIQIYSHVLSTGDTGVQIHEQALVLDTDQGLVVLTGCAHPGIVQIVKKAHQILNKNVYMVLGGFHLMETPPPQIKAIISEFRTLGVQKVGATHCTGEEAIQMFREEWGDHFVELGVGRKISISK